MTDVVADPARARGPETGPVLEGPVLPQALLANDPARSVATKRNRTGLDPVRRVSGDQSRRPVVGVTRTGSGVSGASGTGRMPARRPLMVVVTLVCVAVLMMAATVAGVSRPPGQSSTAVARDAVFVARATALCETGLSPMRAQGATMSAPKATAAVGAAASHAAAIVAAVEVQMRSLALAPDATGPIQDWLGSWSRYVADQRLLAAALRSFSRQGSVPPRVSAGTPAQLAALVKADANRSDNFAAANALTACSLSPVSSQPRLLDIP